MSQTTRNLHGSLLAALDGGVVCHSDLGSKPLLLDLEPPQPPHLRVYAYSLVGGMGTVRPTEYKAVLRVPGQPVGEYGSFDYSGGRFVVLVGIRSDLDVFALWDASLHSRFKNGGNIQLKEDAVLTAASTGSAVQLRKLTRGQREAVFLCQSWNLAEAIDQRLRYTGTLTDEEWTRLETSI